MTRILNGVTRTGRLGRLIMIPKLGKNLQKPESHRPIALLSTTVKVFGRSMLKHLYPHIAPRHEQFGFRRARSRTLQLTRVLHFLAEPRNRKEQAAAVLLDIEKAFDRVWHEWLLFKLSALPAPRSGLLPK